MDSRSRLETNVPSEKHEQANYAHVECGKPLNVHTAMCTALRSGFQLLRNSEHFLLRADVCKIICRLLFKDRYTQLSPMDLFLLAAVDARSSED